VFRCVRFAGAERICREEKDGKPGEERKSLAKQILNKRRQKDRDDYREERKTTSAQRSEKGSKTIGLVK